MINIKENEVIITKDIWDSLSEDEYIKEVINNLLDSEKLADAINSDYDFIDIREYDKRRKSKKV